MPLEATSVERNRAITRQRTMFRLAFEMTAPQLMLAYLV
jgi:hypothetical protein